MVFIQNAAKDCVYIRCVLLHIIKYNLWKVTFFKKPNVWSILLKESPNYHFFLKKNIRCFISPREISSNDPKIANHIQIWLIETDHCNSKLSKNIWFEKIILINLIYLNLSILGNHLSSFLQSPKVLVWMDSPFSLKQKKL